MDNFLTREENDMRSIFNRFRNRNFSGNTGQAIKNSSYQLATNIVMKFGSLFFTIIVARLLMPEKMGLYSLALSTILLFAAFSDFGIINALLIFTSKSLGKKNPEKAKAYLDKLLKWKTFLVIVCSILLLLSAYFVSKFYYQKPIFYALLVGGLYLPAVSFLGFVEQLFRTMNNFKYPLIKEVIFQTLRLTLVPLGILLLLKTNLSNGLFVAGVILILTFCYLVSILFLISSARKKIPFIKSVSEKLTAAEVGGLKRFIYPMVVTALSGFFFGYIDTLLLGHFVSAEYIAYYGVAFGLVGSAIAIIGFTSVAAFPLFARLEGKSLQRFFSKTRNFTIFVSFFSSIATFFLANLVVKIAYGSDYLIAVPLLKYFAILVFIFPISSIYDNYIVSQGKTKFIAWMLIISTVLNILLNLVGITYGLKFGMFEAVLGSCFATIISRLFYFAGVVLYKRKLNLQEKLVLPKPK